jgi:hypothetical protein
MQLRESGAFTGILGEYVPKIRKNSLKNWVELCL